MAEPSETFITPLFLGVDVGGTNIKLGVVDDQGATVCYTKFPSQADQPPESTIDKVRPVIEKMLADTEFCFDDIAAVGVGTPGPMDIDGGKMLTPFNMLGWHHFPIRDYLKKATGKPVAYANDAAAAAFGEYWIGSGRQYNSMVLITLGTGVGCGIIVNDMSIDGAHSHGAEAGHIIIDTSDDALMCTCGKRGHLEAYASATGIVARAKTALRDHPESSMLQCNNETSPLSALAVSQAASAGDALAKELVQQTADYLARGIATLAHVVDPQAFILGGAVNFGGDESPLGRSFLDRVMAETRKLVFPVVGGKLVVNFAKLGSDAGYVGAAGMARTQFAKSASL
jgi:glucokinase